MQPPSSRRRTVWVATAFGALAGLAVLSVVFQQQQQQDQARASMSMLWSSDQSQEEKHERAHKQLVQDFSLSLASMQANITTQLSSALEWAVATATAAATASTQAAAASPAVSESEVAAASSPVVLRFREAMTRFPWAEAAEALKWEGTHEQSLALPYLQRLLDELEPYLIMPSPEPDNAKCEMPALPAFEDIDCSKYPQALTGKRRKTPVKVAHTMQLGFDADVMEIQLNELDAVADKIFVLESTRTHNKNLRKPLLWERIKVQPRFEKFADKVVHIVLDDVDALAANVEGDGIWARENLQERVRWEAFRTWNERNGKYFGPDDLVGFGDADNIPSVANVHLLRHCEVAGPTVDIGSWMPWGGLNRAFRPDWPVPSNPWTYGDPAYWPLRDALALENRTDGSFPSRRRGKSGHHLVGGIHMTDNPYAPFLWTKRIACTECAEEGPTLLAKVGRWIASEEGRALSDEEFVAAFTRFVVNPYHQERAFDVKQVKESMGDAYYIPWFLECNPDKYPSWYGKLDKRLL